MNLDKKKTLVRLLLTVTAFEFFGPVLRDIGESHLQNPEWAGHARFHLGWFLSFMAFSGLVNMTLIWGNWSFSRIRLAFALQACNLGGFWVSCLFSPVYDGLIIDGKYHTAIFGINENVLVFIALSAILLTNYLIFRLSVSPAENPTAPRVSATARGAVS